MKGSVIPAIEPREKFWGCTYGETDASRAITSVKNVRIPAKISDKFRAFKNFISNVIDYVKIPSLKLQSNIKLQLLSNFIKKVLDILIIHVIFLVL